jgi:hypothetical protein
MDYRIVQHTFSGRSPPQYESVRSHRGKPMEYWVKGGWIKIFVPRYHTDAGKGQLRFDYEFDYSESGVNTPSKLTASLVTILVVAFHGFRMSQRDMSGCFEEFFSWFQDTT